MINLRLIMPYLSIRAFPSVALPDFTLVTGLNGAGKTHLLRAIGKGDIQVEGISDPIKEIRYFDWGSLVPQSEGMIRSAQLEQEKDNLFQQFDQAFDQSKQALVESGRAAGLPAHYLADPKLIAKLTHQEIDELVSNQNQSSQIKNYVQNISTHMRNTALQHHPNFIEQVDEFLAKTSLPLAAYDRKTFREFAPVAWGQADLFQRSFSRLFVIYRDLLIRNELQMLAKSRGQPHGNPLSKEEFERKYNIPPWVFLNETLQNAALDFEVDAPDLFSVESYELKLRKKSSGAEVNFSDLSSGEKVLMSLANCLYSASDSRQITKFPKLLLLDEVDAPLHPSMSRTLVRTLTDILVARFGIKIIATTHSPSTVAIALEESIYIMEAGRPGLHKTKKGQALNLLTAGVPTLAISFSGRRQVFVESETDSKIYDRLYELTKSKLNSERSLTFLSPGSRERQGDSNTGCDQVRRIVQSLESMGNHSIFGLIDWDGVNAPTKRTKVLSHGVRDGLENCLFDPLLMACLVARDVPDRCDAIGLKERGGFTQLKALPHEHLQEIVRAVETLVLGESAVTSRRTVQCKYAGGLVLELSESYLAMDDHALEDRIIEVFPALRKYGRRSGALMLHVVDNIVPDYPEYLPHHFIDVFSDLLTVDVD